MRTNDAALLLAASAALSACALLTDLGSLETGDASSEASTPADAGDASANDAAQGACAQTTCGSACVDLKSSATNCGACGRDCLGGACDAGVCTEVQLAAGQDLPEDIAVDGNNVYWDNHSGGTVVKYELATSQTTHLATNQASPQAIAVDSANVYWTNNGANAVMKVAVDGGTASRRAARTCAGRSRARSAS